MRIILIFILKSKMIISFQIYMINVKNLVFKQSTFLTSLEIFLQILLMAYLFIGQLVRLCKVCIMEIPNYCDQIKKLSSKFIKNSFIQFYAKWRKDFLKDIKICGKNNFILPIKISYFLLFKMQSNLTTLKHLHHRKTFTPLNNSNIHSDTSLNVHSFIKCSFIHQMFIHSFQYSL